MASGRHTRWNLDGIAFACCGGLCRNRRRRVDVVQVRRDGGITVQKSELKKHERSRRLAECLGRIESPSKLRG